MNSKWPADHPEPDTLRRDIRHMVDAITETVLDVFGEPDVRAVWFKGSAQKCWDSPMDYVPALSDVDIHVWLSDEAAPRFHQFGTALQVQQGMEMRFTETAVKALHVPRPQLSLVNDLHKLETYTASPAGAIETVYGTEVTPGDYTDVSRIRSHDRAALIKDAAEADDIPRRAIDRPGPYMWDLLRALSWRISPVGSRLLSVSGEDPQRAWSMNRTAIAAALHERRQGKVAADWEQFYASAWRYYLSDSLDGAAGRSALRAARDVLAGAGAAASEN